jgi:phosphatidylglycerol---prolipoprotein diacylglyceryl transferase
MEFVPLLSYIVWDIDPDIFVIPYLDHPVRWYGLSWALGFLFSQQVMYYIYKRDGRPREEVDVLTVYMIVAAIAGARLGHVLFYDIDQFFREPLSVFAIWEGGLASHGGAIGILIALYFFARKTKVRYLWIVDRLVIVSALTGCLIRLGNLMNSEMIGLPTNVPWAFIFVNVDGVPRHPAQLYEAVYCFFLFVFLFWLYYKRGSALKDGLLTGLFLVILFTLRFVDELLKINQEAFEDGLLINMGQILSIPFVIIGINILFLTQKRNTSAQMAGTKTEHADPEHI